MSHRNLSAPSSSARRIAAVSTIAATLLSAAGFGAGVALAQQPAKPAPGAKPAAPAPAKPGASAPAAPTAQPAANMVPGQAAVPAPQQLPPLIYSPWAKFCGKGPQPNDPNAKEVCFTGKDGRTEGGQPVVSAALVEPTGDPTKRFFRVTLPSPLQIEFGTRLIVDQDQPLSGRFFTCYGNMCFVDYPATPELIARLKKGQMLQIQAISLTSDPVSFPVPLADTTGNSFQKAADGPPTDPKVFEEQQKKLQEDLQKRADEMRKKLEQQQPGAAPAK